MNLEKAERIAATLLRCASEIGKVEKIIREECLDCDQMVNSPDLVDAITGPEIEAIRYSMRELAMKLDRAALVKFSNADSFFNPERPEEFPWTSFSAQKIASKASFQSLLIPTQRTLLPGLRSALIEIAKEEGIYREED